MYRVHQVSRKQAESFEQLGTKYKFWYTDSTDPNNPRRMLFKADDRGTGEDWAEKVCCELATLLGLPHVQYEMAQDEEFPGVVSENFAPASYQLVLGNVLLSLVFTALNKNTYPISQRFAVKEHTVKTVGAVIENLIKPPPDKWIATLPNGIRSALDFFIGYVLLDAWVANQDRHHENWGALLDKTELYLAPTFDHGASLARNISDEERKERLTTKDTNRQIPAFAAKASSAFFLHETDKKPLTTLDAWLEFSKNSPQAKYIWLNRLSGIELKQVKSIIDQIPGHRMSEVCREFTIQLLEENKRRLLEGLK